VTIWKPGSDIRSSAEAHQPTDAEVAALRRRVDATLASAHAPRPSWGGWVTLGAVGGLCAAAAAGLVLSVEPAPQPTPFVFDAAGSSVAPKDGVALAHHGAGVVSADGSRVDLTDGSVVVEVTPGLGIDFEVHTDEAVVRVLGTKFEVRRDTFGTSVAVERGAVGVTCAQGAPTSIGPGDEAVCLRSAAAGLARVSALTSDGASLEAQRDAVALALAMPDADGTVLDRLRSLSTDLRVRQGDTAGAIADAERWLGQREDLELRGVIARLSLAEGGCAAATPHLEALVVAGGDPISKVALSDCVRASDPERARALLTAALAEVPAGQATEDVAQRLQSLPR
jgi:hypothetical protein